MIRILGFKTDYKANGEGIDWVHFTSSDAMTESGTVTHSTWERVEALRPPEVIENDDGGLKLGYMRRLWEQIEPAYEAWRSGNEVPEDGTPLAAWPGLNREQADALRGIHILTVEALAAVSDAILSRPVLPNMRELKRQAQMWLDARAGADMAARVAELEAQNAALMEMVTEAAEAQPKRSRKAAEEPEAA